MKEENSPQIENGYTKIANELLEAKMRIRISGEENQIWEVIMRQTYGFNKKSDSISLTQFVLKTGMSKSSICRAISKLQRKKIIYKKVNGNSQIYGINKHFDEWKPLTKKKIIDKKVNEHLQKSKSALTKKRPTKEIYKETITKENNMSFPENLNTPEFKQVWEEWEKHRREIRHKITPTTRKRQLKKLSEWGTDKAIRAINRSIDNGWTGLYEPPETREDRSLVKALKERGEYDEDE